MSKARDASFRAVVIEAIGDVGTDFTTAHEFSRKVAERLLERLHERGLAIHDPANCIRRPWQERERVTGARQTGVKPPDQEGREMTLEEQITLGVTVVSDDVPD